MNPLLEVRELRKTWPSRQGPVQAVRGVGFEVGTGETVALVGESGCGKSTVAMSLLRLVEPDAGQILFAGEDLAVIGEKRRHALRRQLSIVFQNPYSSLNPRMKVRAIVAEPLRTVFGLRGTALTQRIVTALEQVGLTREHMGRYPHEFSGGQRQRIAIARALALEPRLLVLDEPTAALDVSVQAQVLNLLQDLQARLGLSYLLITHDLAVVEVMAERVLVMYLGRIVEAGPVADVFAHPRHPYTRSLLDSIPSLDPASRDALRPPSGEVPSPLDLPTGCSFAPRCPHASETCRARDPILEGPPQEQLVACFHPLARGTSS